MDSVELDIINDVIIDDSAAAVADGKEIVKKSAPSVEDIAAAAAAANISNDSTDNLPLTIITGDDLPSDKKSSSLGKIFQKMRFGGGRIASSTTSTKSADHRPATSIPKG